MTTPVALPHVVGATPPASSRRFELYETNHGIDGWDAKRTLVAYFSDRGKAVTYLHTRGFTFRRGDNHYWHRDKDRRHTMGAISYEIVDTAPKTIPVDPE